MTPISVVICTFNRRDSLERLLLALREQTYPRYEVVVVNGPSTDETAALLASFAGRLRVANCHEASAGRSRNIGIRHAAAEIVAFIDDDAIPPPNWLDQIATGFADEQVSAVGGPTFDVPLGRFDWKICTSTRLGVVNVDSPGPIDRYHGVGADPFPYFAGCNVAHRRQALQAVGGFNEAVPYIYDDTDVCCHLNDAGFRFHYNEQMQVSHFREKSAVRDEERAIVDPYALVLGRIVFSLHCQRTPEGVDNVIALAQQWADEWVAYSLEHLRSGRFTQRQHEQFIARAAAGTAEGIARGRMPRPFATIGPPPTDEFRPYR